MSTNASNHHHQPAQSAQSEGTIRPAPHASTNTPTNPAGPETGGVSRRGVLGLGATLAAMAAAPSILGATARSARAQGAAAAPASGGSGPERVARVLHLTDMHMNPGRAAAEGVAQCLAHGAATKPDMIITGGDNINDGFAADFDDTKTQFDLLAKVFKDHAPCPVRHTIGNHDIWGWNKSRSKTTGDEANWGKKWAVEAYGLEREYYAFDVGQGPGAWRVFILDSTQPDGDGYIAHLDEAQAAWLTSQLDALPADRFALVVSHIPIIAACVLKGEWDGKATTRTMSGGLMHLDSGALHNAFAKNTRVRLCLSGHIHQNDRVDMEGVSYICNGAVSGRWWRGSNGMTREGYGVVDLFRDGTFAYRYAPYDWAARE
jgi:predicted MPP superfamily phosphohydrolase